MRVKNVFLMISLSLGIAFYYPSLALILEDNADPTPDIYASDLDFNNAYEVYHYRFAKNSTINAYISQTPHFSSNAYLAVASDIIGATGINFVPNPIFSGSYRNTVIFSEMDTGENSYLAVAIAFDNSFEPCTSFNSITVASDGTTITGLSFGSGALTSNCTGETVDSGLIVFNTNFWNAVFSPTGTRGDGTWDAAAGLWVPPINVQRNLILHEFSHLLGLGHAVNPTDPFNFLTQGNCNSIMVRNIVGTFITPTCTGSVPNAYWTHDRNVLGQIGYF